MGFGLIVLCCTRMTLSRLTLCRLGRAEYGIGYGIRDSAGWRRYRNFQELTVWREAHALVLMVCSIASSRVHKSANTPNPTLNPYSLYQSSKSSPLLDG
jgi:hypothetical protein